MEGQARVAARIPGAAALGLVPPPGTSRVPGTMLADPEWTAELLTARSRQMRTSNRRVLATVWWYSLSTVLLTPPLAGLVAGIPLSARLADTTVAMSGGHPVAAVSGAPGGGVAAELRESITAVVAAVAEAGRMRVRPLWAIATDSLANQLLALGTAVGDVPRATSLAPPLAAAIGFPLPAPRYVDVGRATFTRRASCCLVEELPSGSRCTSCPRRPPAERRLLLERAAGRS